MSESALLFVEEARAIAAAIEAAREVGVLERLADGPCDLDNLAAACGIDRRPVAILLQALVASGVVRQGTGGDHTLDLDVEMLASKGSWWNHLAETLRTGEPAVALDRPEEAAIFYAESLPMVGHLLDRAAERVAGLLAPVARGARVLDVGSGTAPWAIALARRDPGCTVVALDLPKVLDVTQQAVADAGCGDRFQFRHGDAFAVELEPAHYDVAIVANVCHLFDASANVRLLRRVHRALRAGGRLAIIDMIGSEPGPRSRWVALYSLGLMLRTSAGAVHSFADYGRWCARAGFGDVGRADLDAMPMTLLTTRRRE